MAKSIVSEGKTTNEAIEKGLKELHVSKNDVEIKVLEEKKKTFFDILAPNVVRVELTVKEGAKEIVEKKKVIEERVPQIIDQKDLEEAKSKVEVFIKDFIKIYDNEIKYTIKIEDNEIFVVLEGEAANNLIGYRGATLNSLQKILRSIANRGKDINVRVILDIDNYLETRRKTLEDLAFKLEKTVKRTGKQVKLEPMSAYERKIIHLKLQDSKYVKTYSIGEGDRRRVIVDKK